MKMLKRGYCVWGKMKSYPWWPAMIITAKDCGRKENGKLWLFWFGDHKYSEISKGIQVEDFQEFFKTYAKKNMHKKPFQKALAEALQLLASMNGTGFRDTASMTKWAMSDRFRHDSSLTFRWKQSELPEFIRTAIAKSLVTSDSDDSDMDVDVDVGIKCLNPVSEKSICTYCEETDQKNDTEKQISHIHSGLCNTRETINSVGCLIKWRSLTYLPPARDIPTLDRPINVLAFSETGLEVLRRTEIKVQNYQVSTSQPLKQRASRLEGDIPTYDYIDFTLCEIREIAADLILGSFLTTDKMELRKTRSCTFFEQFFKFLYRLDMTRLFKKSPLPLFIFMAEANCLDESMINRVLKLLEVSPISIEFGSRRKVLVWSNVSYLLSDCRITTKVDYEVKLNDEVEAKILYPFMKHLQKYFEVEKK